MKSIFSPKEEKVSNTCVQTKSFLLWALSHAFSYIQAIAIDYNSDSGYNKWDIINYISVKCNWPKVITIDIFLTRIYYIQLLPLDVFA